MAKRVAGDIADDNKPENSTILWSDLPCLDSHFSRLRTLRDQRRLPTVLLLDGESEPINRSLAGFIAALYLCENGGVACGDCFACLEVKRRRHSDVMWIESSDSLKQEQAKCLQQYLDYQPGPGLWPSRVAVIINCEQMTVQAANRLLKTLEEPPPHARIILTTTKRKLLLATIKSRCTRWLVDNSLTAAVDFTNEEERLLVKSIIGFENLGELVDSVEKLAKDYDISVKSLIDKVEMLLNEQYKGSHSEILNYSGIVHRRQMMQQLRSLAGRGKIALNVRLSAESLGLG